MGLIGRWDDWKCENCGSVNGPRTGPLCDVCAADGEHGEVVELVRADTAQGAVDLLRRVAECCGYTVPGGEFEVMRDELEVVVRDAVDYLTATGGGKSS